MSEVTITTQNFEQEVLKSEKPVLIDFWGEGCGPCKMLAPVIEEVAEVDAKMEDKINIVKIDVDKSTELVKKIGVLTTPTMVVFKNGEVTAQEIGVQKKSTILDMLN